MELTECVLSPANLNARMEQAQTNGVQHVVILVQIVHIQIYFTIRLRHAVDVRHFRNLFCFEFVVTKVKS